MNLFISYANEKYLCSSLSFLANDRRDPDDDIKQIRTSENIIKKILGRKLSYFQLLYRKRYTLNIFTVLRAFRAILHFQISYKCLETRRQIINSILLFVRNLIRNLY